MRNLETESNWWPTWLLYTIWIGILAVLIFCPFLASRERRSRCFRICFCRCNDLADNEGISSFFTPTAVNIVRSYPIGDPRHVFTKKDAENETKTFIMKKLAPSTKVINDNDLVYNASKHSIEDLELGISNLDKEKSSSNIVHPEEDDQNNRVSVSRIEDTELEVSGLDKETSVSKLVHPEEDEQNNRIRSFTAATLPSSTDYFDEANFDVALKLPDTTMPLKRDENDNHDGKQRHVSAECAICLAVYASGDKVAWSSLDCKHAFHEQCIIEWLMTLGKKANRGRQITVLQHHLCKFKMVCPVCRQDFILNATSE